MLKNPPSCFNSDFADRTRKLRTLKDFEDCFPGCLMYYRRNRPLAFESITGYKCRLCRSVFDKLVL